MKKPLAEKSQGSKKETEKRKIDIPKDFIKKIENLGMKVEDAEVLFKSKIDWCAVYIENKIYCTEPGCGYTTAIDMGELTNHMINVHKYGDYPCTDDHCDYVAASKVNSFLFLEFFGHLNIQRQLNLHRPMHKKRSDNNFLYKCSKPNCQSTFRDQYLLNEHMRIHNYEVNYCQYCPYRYVKAVNYTEHLQKHFRTEEHKCSDCGSTFLTNSGLVEHSALHEGIIYSCLVCRSYESRSKHSIKYHLRNKHSDLLGKNINWDSVKKHVKMK